MNNDKVSVPKEVFVLNILAMGVAVQLVAKLTGENIEDWKSWVGQKATEQYNQLSPEQVQAIVDEFKP